MTCTCKDSTLPGALHRHSQTLPAEPCAYCTEKHLCTAAALAREHGYEDTNRQFLIGELANAEAHSWGLPGSGRYVWAAIRSARLAIQSRDVAADAVGWRELFLIVDRLVDEAKERERTGTE